MKLRFCALLSSGLLLTACGQEQAANFDLTTATARWAQPGKTWSESELKQLSAGELAYRRRCAACHSSAGTGQAGIGAPSLKGSATVRGEQEKLIQLVLNGRRSMPAFKGQDPVLLSNILTYIQNAWGNNSSDTVTHKAISQASNR